MGLTAAGIGSGLDVESLIGHEAFTPYLRIDSLPTTKVIDPTKH